MSFSALDSVVEIGRLSPLLFCYLEVDFAKQHAEDVGDGFIKEYERAEGKTRKSLKNSARVGDGQLVALRWGSSRPFFKKKPSTGSLRQWRWRKSSTVPSQRGSLSPSHAFLTPVLPCTYVRMIVEAPAGLRFSNIAVSESAIRNAQYSFWLLQVPIAR